MRISKKNREYFIGEVIKYIENSGAKKTVDTKDSIEFEYLTQTGILHLTVRKEPSDVHFVAGNFVGSEERAKIKFGHWKQNYIVSEDRQDTFECIVGFKKYLENLTE